MRPSPGTILDDAGWYGLPGKLCFQDDTGQTWVGHPGEWEKLEAALARENKVSVSFEVPRDSMMFYVGKSAGDLRFLGFKVQDKVPDCAILTDDLSFEWTEMSFTVNKDEI